MSIIRENNKNRGKVFRCFAIYNVDRQEFTHVQRRKCGKSFESTIQSIRDLAEKQCQLGTATLSLANSFADWYGVLDSQKKCYFLFMLFGKANMKIVQNSLNQLIKLITSIPNYWLLTIEQLDQLKRSDIRKLIDKLETEYLEQEREGVGAPSDDEQVGSKIIIPNQSAKLTNQQSSFRSQQQAQSKIETVNDNYKTLDKEYLEFGVYRGFVLYNPKEKKQLFTLRRGSKAAFALTKDQILQQIQQDSHQTSFVKQFSAKSEWHGSVDEQTGYYFLLMTFQNADKEQCHRVLKELISKFQRHHYGQLSAEEINEQLLWNVSHLLKSAEKHYEFDNGAIGSPSDDDQLPKLCEVKRSAFGATKNYSSFSASKQELISLEILPRSKLLQLGEKEIESPIQTSETILQKLNHFEPQINDTENLLQYSLIGSLIVLLIIFVYLFHQ